MALLGNGTIDSPFLLSSADDVVQMSNGTATATKYFKMTNDIELPYRSASFPIASQRSYFSLDGDGHKFINLSLWETRYSNTSAEKSGIFKTLYNAEIKNVGIEGFNITAYAKIGAFAGETNGICTFENCYVRSSLFKGYALGGADLWRYFGGFVGYSGTSGSAVLTFKNCFVSTLNDRGQNISISGTSYTGGFVGWGKANFENCYFIGETDSTKTVDEGSFVSTAYTATSTFTNSYVVNLGTQNNNNQPTLAQDELTPANLVGFDFDSVWGVNSDFNNGLPMQRIFLPQEIPAVVEKREVSSYMNVLSTTALADLLTAIISLIEVDTKVGKIKTDVVALAKLFIPFIAVVEVNSSVNPFTTHAFAELVAIVRKSISVASEIKPINTEVKRVKIKKYIDYILTHMDAITCQAIVTSKLQPEKVNALIELIENGNDVTLIQYLLNEVYVKEIGSKTQIINPKSTTNYINNRNEVRIVAYTGDSVRLQVKFKTFDSTPINPENVLLKIYETTITSNNLISITPMGEENRTGEGEYTFDYVIPNEIDTKKTDTLVYEFSGTYNGQSTLARGKINIRFV